MPSQFSWMSQQDRTEMRRWSKETDPKKLRALAAQLLILARKAEG